MHRTDQLSVRVEDLTEITRAMQRVRGNPPATLLGQPVAVEDLAPAADVLTLRTAGSRVVIRPSGTEPKLKAYLEVIEPVAGKLVTARFRSGAGLAQLRKEVSAALGL